MAAANESQGLKIAVAAFVTLTVILAVTTYFGYSQYSQADSKFADAEKKAQQNQTTADGALRDLADLKQNYGYGKIDDYGSVKDQIKKDSKKLDEQIGAINTKIKAYVEKYKAAGGSQQKIDELTAAGDQLVNQVISEPNRTAMSTISRVVELLDNMSQLSAELSLDNEDLRRQLADANKINEQKLQVQVAETKKATDDRESGQRKHEEDRAGIMTKHDQLATLNNAQATEITKLKQQLAQMTEDHRKRESDLLSQLRFYREQTEKKEVVLDKPDGRITYVDYERGEVITTITRGMGAKEQMKFVVFDRNAPGIPTDYPKATIQLIRVGDSSSIARIVETKKTHDPIRIHDQVYSAAWSPNTPERFALIGKIDVDRDGRDDREDLKRMIRAAGGVIDYDLPPAGVGTETGKLTPLTSWYVIDDREPIHPPTERAIRESGADDANFLQKKTEAIRLARLEGVRPMSIERILAYLGYTFGEKVPGRVEAINRNAVRLLTNPRGRPAAGAAVTPPAGAQEKAATPEEAEEKKADDADMKPDDAAKKDAEPKSEDPK
jgi:hypothetical protein